jgi:uncharacterized tellurite resistance protein B-like protein
MAADLGKLFRSIHPNGITSEEAEAILAIAQLVVDIDGREGPEEIKLFFEVGKQLFVLAGKPNESIPTFASDADDEERMFELATTLKSSESRELTYAIARMLADVDLDTAPDEDTFIDRLRGVLSITKPRANEVAANVRAAQ